MKRAIRKSVFFLLALPLLLRAAWRLTRLKRRLQIDELAEHLRDVPPLRVAFLRNPQWLCACLDRSLWLLPPPGYHACLHRALLLLDLWARCGLVPRLRLGIRGEDGRRTGHAWVTGGAAAAPATDSLAYPETFDF